MQAFIFSRLASISAITFFSSMASIAYPQALTLDLVSSKAALLSALRLSMMAIRLSHAAMTVTWIPVQSN
jgi:hypothetical protein